MCGSYCNTGVGRRLIGICQPCWKKIGEVPNALHCVASITGVDGNESDADETDVREYPNYR